MRGISDGAITGRTQSTTGIYFGDIGLTYAAPDPDLRLVDAHSVETLRGPQSALYGAGATDGIIRIEPNHVDLTKGEGYVQVDCGAVDDGHENTVFEIAGNVPVS